MKRSKFNEDQILKEIEITAKTVADVCRENGFDQSSKYGDIIVHSLT